jgi:hypothetical protein
MTALNLGCAGLIVSRNAELHPDNYRGQNEYTHHPTQSLRHRYSFSARGRMAKKDAEKCMKVLSFNASTQVDLV